jgi:DeoR/GlpR family transcriptional regulator of sugar metabolism
MLETRSAFNQKKNRQIEPPCATSLPRLILETKMYKHERHAKILELLSTNGFWSTEDLAHALDVSQTTLYRDLKELEDAGAIQKQYGGVVPARKFISNIDFKVRETFNIVEKEAIAERAVDLIDDNDSFFLDTSTTCLVLARKLLEKRRKNLTIITNSCRIVLMLEDEPEYRTICTGGTYIKRLDLLVGSPAEEFIQTLNICKYFFSATGISNEGCADTEPAEVKIKKLVVSRVQQKILLADHTKFSQMATFKTVGPQEIDILVTDSLTPAEKLVPFVEHNVQIIRATLPMHELTITNGAAV